MCVLTAEQLMQIFREAGGVEEKIVAELQKRMIIEALRKLPPLKYKINGQGPFLINPPSPAQIKQIALQIYGLPLD